MSVFEKSKKHLTILGIGIVSKQNLPKFLRDYQLALNRIQISCVIFLFGSYIFTTLYTLIFEANGFSEITEASTYFIIGLVHSSFLSISIWKRPKIMAFMDNLDDVIAKSMFGMFQKSLSIKKAITQLGFRRKWTPSGSHRLYAIDSHGRYVFEFHLENNIHTKHTLHHSRCNNLVLQLFHSWWNGAGISVAHSNDVSEYLMIIIR